MIFRPIGAAHIRLHSPRISMSGHLHDPADRGAVLCWRYEEAGSRSIGSEWSSGFLGFTLRAVLHAVARTRVLDAEMLWSNVLDRNVRLRACARTWSENSYGLKAILNKKLILQIKNSYQAPALIANFTRYPDFSSSLSSRPRQDLVDLPSGARRVSVRTPAG